MWARPPCWEWTLCPRGGLFDLSSLEACRNCGITPSPLLPHCCSCSLWPLGLSPLLTCWRWLTPWVVVDLRLRCSIESGRPSGCVGSGPVVQGCKRVSTSGGVRPFLEVADSKPYVVPSSPALLLLLPVWTVAVWHTYVVTM